MRPSVLGLLLASASLVGCANQQAASPTSAVPGTPNGTATAPLETQPQLAVARPVENPNGRWVSAATSSDFMLAGSSQQSFGVFIDVPEGAKQGHVPTSLTLAVDTSGSMRGDKIIHARDAAHRLVQSLHDGDRLSIVTFADRGRVRMSPIIIDGSSRRTALAVIEELSADGGTAMFEGLKVAESQMWSTPDTHLVRRLVVISDGKATEGPTSPEELGRVAEVGLSKGIQVTSVGVGLDYDETTLNALAIRSSGRLYHVEHSEQLPGIVEREVALLESTAAADVKVELVAAPGVQLLGTDTAQVQWTTEGMIIPVGAVFEGQQRELLVQARVDNAVEGTKVLASVRLHFRDPGEDGLQRVQETILRATVTNDASLVAAHTDSRTQTLIAMREASLFAQQASAQANLGDLDRADRELARAEKTLQAQAARTHNEADKARVLRSAAGIAGKRKSLKKAAKAPAPARAKASRQVSLELNDAAMDAFGY
ncbi:MAG: VWA domain-containing protein [Deltaproteobacteria bacterium]|nr:VWA domain-containing protein [Deltaproteobacteria bacterium]